MANIHSNIDSYLASCDVQINKKTNTESIQLSSGIKVFSNHFYLHENANMEKKSFVFYNHCPNNVKGSITLSMFFETKGNNAVACSFCNAEIKNKHNDADQEYMYCSIYYPQVFLNTLTQKGISKNYSDQLLSFEIEQNTFKEFFSCNLLDYSISKLNHIFNNTTTSTIKIHALLLDILIKAVEELEENNIHSNLVESRCKFLNNPVQKQKIQLAKKIIDNNLDKPISIKKLCKQIATNECYLKRGFKEIYDSTIYEYFNYKRMQLAYDMLINQKKTVTEVANILGFSSLAHFSTAFKKQMGINACELLK